MHLCPDEIVGMAWLWQSAEVLRTFGGNCWFRWRCWLRRQPWDYLSEEWVKRAWRR